MKAAALTTQPKTLTLVGSYRRFGDGPVYQIVSMVDGDTAVIRVVESGEELEYPLAKILDDDEA